MSERESMPYDVVIVGGGPAGLAASIRLKHKGRGAIFTFEPFFRYWDIDESDRDDTYHAFVEPANETTEYGIQLIWMF